MKNRTRLLSYSALMCAIIIVSTLWLKFSIPGTDMLVTTQVFFILLCGQILPARYCYYTIGTYIFIGLMGVPVFSAVAGPAVLATPSFGYLLAFPFAAAVTATISRRMNSQKAGRYIASLVGVVVMYVISLSYIAALKSLYLHDPMPLGALLGAYCFAFLPLDVLKAILAALLGKRLEKPLKLYDLQR